MNHTMLHRCGLLAGLAIWLAAASSLRAETPPSTPRLPEALAAAVVDAPAESDLVTRAAAGKLAAADLLAAALTASGASDAERKACLEKFQATVRHIQDRLREREQAGEKLDAEARAAIVHAALHERILKGEYDLGCSRLPQAMRTGRYNCVTATVLFNALANEVGLETSAGETPAHVVSIVKTPGGPLAVETTCPRWFERRAARTAGEPAQGAKYDRELGVQQLVALVYYNIGVDLAEERRFSAALAANYKALRLDPKSRNARTNLLAAVNNWALELAEQSEFTRAIEIIEQGRRFAPDHATFAINDLALNERHVRWLFQRGKWSEAEAVLERVSTQYPSHPYFDAARRQLEEHRAWTVE